MSADDSPLHTSTEDECFAACLQADACVAVEFLKDNPPAGKPGSCWLRSAIRPSECELIAGTLHYTTVAIGKEVAGLHCYEGHGGVPTEAGDPEHNDNGVFDCLEREDCIGFEARKSSPYPAFQFRSALNSTACEQTNQSKHVTVFLKGRSDVLVSPMSWDWAVITVGGNSGKCLARYQDGDDLYNGASVTLWDCDANTPYQQWAFMPQSGATGHWGAGRLGAGKGHHPQFCLDSGDVYYPSALFLWECNGYPQQQFSSDNAYGHYNDYIGAWRLGDSTCLDAGDMTSGAAIEVTDCSASDQQTWAICGCTSEMPCPTYRHDYPTGACSLLGAHPSVAV